METFTKKLKNSRAFLCLECGKCTAVCPISLHNNSYSPRRLLAEGVFYDADNLSNDQLLWSCLTCQLCTQRCPVDVHYSEYMRDAREEARKQGGKGSFSHGGALNYIMEMASCPELKQNRTEWISNGLKTSQHSDYLYFVGCLPYYQDFFSKDFDFSPIQIAKDTVKILNHLGIEPVVLDDERCCGHDLYWLGQLDKFDKLGKLNIDVIKSSKAKTIVTACPECAVSLDRLYTERLGGTGLKIKHITEIVAENIDKFDFKEIKQKISYQDPCRLGRYLGVYDQPRQVFEAIPGIEFNEMLHNKRGAICCGTTNWTNCDAVSKAIQRSRLNEAKNAGAETIVAACPKCQIHFRCAECCEEQDKINIGVTDFVNLVASAI